MVFNLTVGVNRSKGELFADLGLIIAQNSPYCNFPRPTVPTDLSHTSYDLQVWEEYLQ